MQKKNEKRHKICQIFEFPPEVIANGLMIHVYSNVGFCVQNYLAIQLFTEQKIVLKTEKGNLLIRGSDFCIADMDEAALSVEGMILDMQFQLQNQEL